MASKLDMALDDIIGKKKEQTRGGGRGAHREGRGRGGRYSRPAPYSSAPRQSSMSGGRWTHDMYRGDRDLLTLLPLTGSSTVKINITNLDFRVTDSDIRELFQEFGDVRSAAVHYDRSGRSLGSAQVLFSRQSDAMKAMKQYNGVHLDGRPMKIYIEGSEGAWSSAPSRPLFNRLNQRGRGSRPGGRGRGRQSNKPKPKTAKELDAELDSYLTEAKKAK